MLDAAGFAKKVEAIKSKRASVRKRFFAIVGAVLTFVVVAIIAVKKGIFSKKPALPKLTPSPEIDIEIILKPERVGFGQASMQSINMTEQLSHKAGHSFGLADLAKTAQEITTPAQEISRRLSTKNTL